MSQNANITDLQSLHRLVWISLVAALLVIGAYAHFPLGPVPISLQCLFVLLAGFLLGPIGGLLAVGLYVAAGLVGLPVFHGGHSGLGHLLGPTGGYILGFLCVPLITGLGRRAAQSGELGWLRGLGLAVLGYLPIYLFGLTWLKASLDVAWLHAAGVGMLPFLPSDALQILGSVAVARGLSRQNLLPPA
jgi:biotin transport system substrate-specific component